MKHKPFITPEMEKAIREIVRSEIEAFDRGKLRGRPLPGINLNTGARVEWNNETRKWERLS